MAPSTTDSTHIPPWPKYTRDALLEIMAGNEDAAQMMLDIAACSHIYDDLIDGDKRVQPEDIHSLVWRLLATIPLNPFFREHETMLRPLLITGIINWHAANQMEQGGELEELRIAHAIRYSIGDVGLMAMALAGGHDHAVKNARRARLLFQYDTWAHYKSEHAK